MGEKGKLGWLTRGRRNQRKRGRSDQLRCSRRGEITISGRVREVGVRDRVEEKEGGRTYGDCCGTFWRVQSYTEAIPVVCNSIG